MTPRWQNRLRTFAPVPLRWMIGTAFLIHGYPKLFTADGNQAFMGMLAGIGVPAPGPAAYLIGAFEFFGGILLLLGVGVRVVSFLGAVEMLVAAGLVHASEGFNFIHVTGTTDAGAPQFGLPGYEVNLLYLAGFLSLLISGAGRLGLPSVREHASQSPVQEEAVSAHDST